MNSKNRGKFCPNHPDKKCYSKGICRKCYEKQLIDNNPEYKERQQQQAKAWNRKHKERKAIWDKEYRKTHPQDKEKKYFSTIFKNLNFTKEEYEELFIKSENKCNICGKSPYEGKKLHLDHNHETGKVRGLLCTRCNWYLHTIEKNPLVLEIIKQYLNL